MRSLSDFLNALGAGLAAFLEREAGYELLSLVLIAIGMLVLDPPTRAQVARDLVSFALGILARSMGARRTPQVQP
jgi:hypothetical protein